MSFEHGYKKMALEFEQNYQFKTEGKPGDTRIQRLERDYWDYIENQRHD